MHPTRSYVAAKLSIGLKFATMVRRVCPECGKYGRDRCVCKTKNKIHKKTSSSCKPPTKCEDEPPAAPVQDLAPPIPARMPKPADFSRMDRYYRCMGVWAKQMTELKAEHAKDIAKLKEELAEKEIAWALKLGEASGRQTEGARTTKAHGKAFLKGWKTFGVKSESAKGDVAFQQHL